MSILDELTIQENHTIERLVDTHLSKELDPKRFDMCIVIPCFNKVELANILLNISKIRYISNVCDDFEICQLSGSEIISQQIGAYFDTENIKVSDQFFVIQFTARMLRYTRFLLEMTLIVQNVFGNAEKMNLFWAIGGGFLGEYRWKRTYSTINSEVFEELWKIVKWNIKDEHRFLKDVSRLFKDTVSHSKDCDLEKYGQRSINLIKRMRDNYTKRHLKEEVDKWRF